jgi:RHS repeat-associated protein
VIGRLVRQRWAHGNETLERTRAWDPAGRLASVGGPDGTTSYTYDLAGNLVSVDAPGAERDLAYTWDLAGRRSSVTHPDGAVVASTYDPLGRLATVSHPTLGTTTYAWGPDGRLLGEDLPGAGNDRSWSYDAATGVVTRYLQHLGGATVDTALGHDKAGRLTSAATAGGPAQTYAYDKAGQLTSVRTNGTPTHSYTYDPLGRRTRSTDASGTFDYAYDPAGRLASRTTPDADYPLSVKAQVNGQTVGTLAGHRPGDATFTYDAAGRRTKRTATEATTTYAYGPDGKLLSTASGPLTTSRAYDAAGRLAAVTVDDGTPDTTRLVWDDSGTPQPLELADARGRIELVDGVGLIGVTTTTGPALVSTDHLGSVLSTPATASLVAEPSYGPFGEANGSGPRPEPTLGYRGELQTGSLLHLRARDYDASAGAFTSRDPLDGVDGTPTVANLYHYADNDPLNRVDPTGMSAINDRVLRAACAAPPVLVTPDPSRPAAHRPWRRPEAGAHRPDPRRPGARRTRDVLGPGGRRPHPNAGRLHAAPGSTNAAQDRDGWIIGILALLAAISALILSGGGGGGGGTGSCTAPQTPTGGGVTSVDLFATSNGRNQRPKPRPRDLGVDSPEDDVCPGYSDGSSYGL